jgi:hypothetical protein
MASWDICNYVLRIKIYSKMIEMIFNVYEIGAFLI